MRGAGAKLPMRVLGLSGEDDREERTVAGGAFGV